MNANLTIIKEQKEFENVWNLINKVFNIKQTFPNQVFKAPFTGFVFEEFDWAISGEFWDTIIKKLSHLSQDDNVVVAVLDPDPISYFQQTFGYYNILKLSVDITRRAYWEALEAGPPKSPADAMLFNSETIVWVPLTAKWAIWGERSYGICCLAFSDTQMKAAAAELTATWSPAQDALEDFVAINFENEKIPSNFINTFLSNY